MDNSNELLRKVQLTELRILLKFRDICDRHSLTYYLCSGTLLGAVRHRGFIPWDDDIDVSMPYKDYLRFLEVGQNELGDDYFVQNCQTEDAFPSSFTKIRLNNTLFMDSDYSSWHIHHGVWIDIFPLIYINKKELKHKRTLLKVGRSMQMHDLIESNPEVFVELYGHVTVKILNTIYRIIPLNIRKKMHKRILTYIASNFDGEYCCEMAAGLRYVLPKNVFADYIFLEFEGERFKVPIGYDEYLVDHFGDYMTLPPEEERNGLHADIIKI